MERTERLDELHRNGRMHWINDEHGWSARPDEVMTALSSDGFQEYKRETTRSHRDRVPTGGVWQGLNQATGAVASAIWVTRSDASDALVFIDIDGEPLQGP